jgi:hypothetical protein
VALLVYAGYLAEIQHRDVAALGHYSSAIALQSSTGTNDASGSDVLVSGVDPHASPVPLLNRAGLRRRRGEFGPAMEDLLSVTRGMARRHGGAGVLGVALNKVYSILLEYRATVDRGLDAGVAPFFEMQGRLAVALEDFEAAMRRKAELAGGRAYKIRPLRAKPAIVISAEPYADPNASSSDLGLDASVLWKRALAAASNPRSSLRWDAEDGGPDVVVAAEREIEARLERRGSVAASNAGRSGAPRPRRGSTAVRGDISEDEYEDDDDDSYSDGRGGAMSDDAQCVICIFFFLFFFFLLISHTCHHN